MNSSTEVERAVSIQRAVEEFSHLTISMRLILLISELLILIGQFLPLKSVLIIHGSYVPEFFQPFIGSDPTIAALVLFSLGIGFFFTGKVVRSIPRFATARRGNIYLAPTAFLMAFVLAPFMAVLGLGFIGLVWIFSNFRRVRTTGRGLHSRDRDFLKRLEENSMIITAFAALFTTLLFPPAWGLFGVLAAAVLINRAQREMRPVISSLTGDLRRSVSSRTH